MFLTISLSLDPLKGRNPVTMTNKIQPQAQISHEGATALGLFLRASGGRYFKEPGLSVSVWTPAYAPAIPKSII